MAIRAVLFDFSGTLFRLEPDEFRLAELTDQSGDPLDIAAQTELMRRMTAPVGQVVELDAEHQKAWEMRDLDPAKHRAAYLEVLRRSGISDIEQAEALYGRLTDPLQWTAYPDAGDALAVAASSGRFVGIVSNIAYDIRPAFGELANHIDEFVLSFEVGSVKPDPTIFRTAFDRLGIPGRDALMIGDSEEADGAARELGCAFALVEPVPTTQRPNALLTALREHGVH